MSDSVDNCMSCPICLEVMKPPIRQCEKGHSVCGECLKSNNIVNCPLCRSAMCATRNYQLEQLIEKLTNIELVMPCAYASKGCKMKVQDPRTHELECKFRNHNCEGKKFCGWTCNWTGTYEELAEHFKSTHRINQFKVQNAIKINLSVDSADVQAVDYHQGSALFWYKHRVDVAKEKVYWLFQYVGLKKHANSYYYEFEIFDGPVRKLKITEICEASSDDGKVDFESLNCVELSFKTIKNLLNDGMLHFRYRIMNVRKEPHAATAASPPVAPCAKKPVQPTAVPVIVPAAQPINIPHPPQFYNVTGTQRNSPILPLPHPSQLLTRPQYLTNSFIQLQLQQQQQHLQQQQKKYQSKKKTSSKR